MVRWIVGVIVVLGLCTGVSAAPPAPESLAPGLVNPGYEEKPAWFKNSFLDLREDVREAATHGRRVLLFFYQDGCPYCAKLLHENLSQRTIEERMRSGFDVIAVDLWGDREVTGLDGAMTREKDFAAALKVMFTPTLVFLDEQGKVVLRLNGYYPPPRFLAALDYVAGRHESRVTFRDYMREKSPTASSGVLHDEPGFLAPPFRLEAAARKTGKPLAVFFEQHDCPPCDELHGDLLDRPESRAELARFDALVLDLWGATPLRTPQGKDTTAAGWARDLEVKYAPTMVLFDASGQEVIRAEAWLRGFHIQSLLDYVASGAWREQPNFQRFIQARADALEAKGIHVDIMK